MTLQPARAGGWGLREKLTSAQMSALQAELLKALDGVGGGTYTLEEKLILALGEAFRLETGLEVAGATTFEGTSTTVVQEDATFNFESGSQATFEAGATCRIEGTHTIAAGATLGLAGTMTVTSAGLAHFLSGGELRIDSLGELTALNGGVVTIAQTGFLNVAGDTTFEASCVQTVEGDIDLEGELDLIGSGARINVQSGAKIIGSSGAEIRVNDADDLTINSSSYVFRVALTPIHVGAQWESEPEGTFICATTGTSNYLVFPLRVPVGDVITSLSMRIDGGAGAGHGGTPTDRPVLELCTVDSDGNLSVLQTRVDPGASYDSPHGVPLSTTPGPGVVLPYTMTSEMHVVRVLGEGLIGGVDNTTRLCSITGSAQAKSVRQTTEVY